ncbi:MAG TPA: BON domain-containing protein [Quisquiliibacterium sp.]|jgi:osmotically-inducible protein OsmY|nr:BON domain-containing protein [Quisquiliibacterium sp.]
MNRNRIAITALACALSVGALTGCAVSRGQSTVGEYIDDSAITTSVKARFVDSREVAASSISVETLNGTVLLSGFATSANERIAAERIAREVKGVQSVRNEIVVQR